MQAAVLHDLHRPLEMETVDLQAPQDGEVRVKVVGSGVCRSDLSVIEGKMPGTPDLPLILGHEAAGVVEEIGPGVRTVEVGDHVVITFYPGCGSCNACMVGNPFLCRNLRPGRMRDGTTRLSLNGKPVYHYSNISAFAEYVVVSERGCIKIRKDVPLELACLIGCGVITGFASVIRHAKVEVGSSTAVIGCGGVGLNVIQACRVAGATTVIAIDVSESKLELAKHFGATDVINSSDLDATARVRELTDGRGVDYSFEVIGVPALIRQAYDMTAAAGLVTIVGVAKAGQEVSFPAIDFGNRKTITWASAGNSNAFRDIPRIVDLYRLGSWMIGDLVSATRPLDQVNEAFDDLREGNVARTVLLPGT